VLERFFVRGLRLVESVELRVDQSHVVEQGTERLARARVPVDHETGGVVSQGPREIATHARQIPEILRDHRGEQRVVGSARVQERGGVQALSVVDVAANDLRRRHPVERVRDAADVAERFRDVERCAEAVERGVELAFVDVRARDTPYDRVCQRAVAGPQQV